MDPMQEQMLVEKAKKGDQKAFEQLIIPYEKIVYNIIYRMINNIDDTYDLSQETFIKVYRSLHQFDGKSKFSTWIYRIATNTCVDELRKRKGKTAVSIDQMVEKEDGEIMPQYEDHSENVEEKIINKEKTKVLELAFSEMKEDYKYILTLRDIQGLSYDDIANILGISLGTVKSRISRARTALKTILMQNKEPFISYFRQIARREEQR